QPSSNLPRVHILTLKAEDAAAGNYSESWQLRESVDNALSKAVRKILGVSVVGLVNERQDGIGVNRLGPCYSSEMLCTWVSMYILMTSKARMYSVGTKSAPNPIKVRKLSRCSAVSPSAKASRSTQASLAFLRSVVGRWCDNHADALSQLIV